MAPSKANKNSKVASDSDKNSNNKGSKNKGKPNNSSNGKDGDDRAAAGSAKLKPATAINVRHILVRGFLCFKVGSVVFGNGKRVERGGLGAAHGTWMKDQTQTTYFSRNNYTANGGGRKKPRKKGDPRKRERRG